MRRSLVQGIEIVSIQFVKNQYDRLIHGILAAVLSAVAILPGIAHATIVEFQTSLGNFQVNLYDEDTPQTVANFLNYRNNGAYEPTIVHRSVPNFVIQGGGFDTNLMRPTLNAPVINEPVFSNVRGTIAMAKIGGDPDSATSQWFINLSNNSANLDSQNGGFTVFGEVIGDGMDVVDAIQAIPPWDWSTIGPFDSIPLLNYTAQDFVNGVQPSAANVVTISAIVVIDAAVDTAAGLSPALNTTAGNPPPTVPPPTTGGGGGGGSIGLLSLLAMLIIYRRRGLSLT